MKDMVERMCSNEQEVMDMHRERTVSPMNSSAATSPVPSSPLSVGGSVPSVSSPSSEDFHLRSPSPHLPATSPLKRTETVNFNSNRSESGNEVVAPPVSRNLAFSIDNILRPDFGKKNPDRKPVDLTKTEENRSSNNSGDTKTVLWPAWVFCTRYSDRPSSGPRARRIKRREKRPEEKRPRTAFTAEQLGRLKQEFDENRYLTEKRRQDLARDLNLNEAQIKIWFQNKRAKIKKSSGQRGSLALQLMAQGLYNHATVPVDEDDEMIDKNPVCSSI